MRANFAAFVNALCHLNATPLSVAVLAPCAWGVWLRGNAQHNSLASVAKWAVLVGKAGKAKMGQCLGGGLLSLSLSLVARTFWHTKIFKYFIFGLFAFVIVSRLHKNGGLCHFELSLESEKSTL